jgi:hypothetical protein
VHVGSATGPTVVERTLEEGQTVRFGLAKPLWIRLGDPPSLDATIAGRDVTAQLPAQTGDVLVTAKEIAPA